MSKYPKSGKGSNAKLVKYKLYPEEGSKQLFMLSPRQIGALLSSTEPLSWMNRHTQLPSDISTKDTFQSWIDDLRLALMSPVDYETEAFCQLMIENADCFLQDENVTNQLIDRLGEKLTEFIKSKERKLPPEFTGNNLLSATGCDVDLIYAVCLAIAEYLHTQALKLFAQIEQLTNPAERVTLFTEAMESDTNFAIDEAYEFIDDLIENVQEEYNATFDLIELSCDIFCMFKDDCSMNINSLQKFYFDKIAIETDEFVNPFKLLQKIVTFLFTGDIPTNLVVYAMHSLVIAVINTNKKFLGENYYSLESVAKSADEPNNDHEIYCTACALLPWTYNQNLREDDSFIEMNYEQDGFTYWNEFVLGEGIKSGNPSLADESIFKLVFPIPSHVTQVKLTVNALTLVGGESAYLFINGVFSSAVPLSSGENVYTFDMDNDVDFLMLGIDRSGGFRASIGYSTNVYIAGIGENPFDPV